MNWPGVRESFVLNAKRALYAGRGEPYEFAGRTLRFIPGSRPVRRKYRHSPNWINRDDVLEMLWMEENVGEGSTAIDVGAHWGIYTIMLAVKCGPRGTVVAFEPDPYAREVLARNVNLNRIKAPRVESFACSDSDCEAVLFSRGGQANSSLAPSVAQRGCAVEEIHVQTTTLDHYVAERSLHPHVVKIDAEGAEIRILRGARKLLKSDARVLCELHPYAWPEFGNSLEELESLVSSASRKIRYLDPGRSRNTYGMTELVR